MSSIGYAALAANLTSTLVVFLFRAGGSSRRSVGLYTRNDAVSNVAVIGVLALHSAHQVITAGAACTDYCLGRTNLTLTILAELGG